MQLAQSPDAGGGIPAQAQTGLPAMAADLADIAPAPPAAAVLQQSALGDRGSQQADALRAAGQQQPPMVAPPAVQGAVAPSMQPNIPEMAPEGSLPDLAAAALASPSEWKNIQAQRAMRFQQQLSLQEEYRRNAAEFYSTMFDVAAKNFPGRPDLAAVFLQNQAAQRGLHLDPSVAAQLRQAIIDGQLTGKQLGDLFEDPNTPISTIRRFGTDLKAFDDLRKAHAEASRAESVASAEPAKNAFEIATRLRGLQRPMTEQEMTTLGSANIAMWPVQVPNAPKGAWMWMPGDVNTPPAGAMARQPNVAPGTPTKPLTAAAVGGAQAGQKASEAAARAAAVDPAMIRMLKFRAPRLISVADRALKALDKVETGPLAGRLQEAWAGGVGAADPDFQYLKAQLMLLAGGMLNIHFGARGGGSQSPMMKDMHDDLLATKQDPTNLRTSLMAAKEFLGDYTPGAPQPGEGGPTPTAAPTAAAPAAPGLSPGAAYAASLKGGAPPAAPAAP